MYSSMGTCIYVSRPGEEGALLGSISDIYFYKFTYHGASWQRFASWRADLVIWEISPVGGSEVDQLAGCLRHWRDEGLRGPSGGDPPRSMPGTVGLGPPLRGPPGLGSSPVGGFSWSLEGPRQLVEGSPVGGMSSSFGKSRQLADCLGRLGGWSPGGPARTMPDKKGLRLPRERRRPVRIVQGSQYIYICFRFP